MYTYPTYSNNQMMNNNQYGNPYVSPYTQQYQQPIQAQQPQINAINCRVVNDFSEIVANDVPMDGRPAFFVKNDMSVAQARAWNSNGTIDCVSFTRIEPKTDEVTNTTNEIQNAQYEEIMSRFDKLEKYLAKPTKATKKVEAVSEDV